MNLKEIRELITLMNENDLTEIEVEREGGKIKLKKAALEGMVEMAPRAAAYYPEPAHGSAPAKIKGGESSEDVNPNRKEIKSPMVGTFYRAPSPESAPFVEVGQMVEVGQVVCIVEAMKLMNEIKSEVRGKVIDIPVENAQPVEFGQTLFTVEPV